MKPLHILASHEPPYYSTNEGLWHWPRQDSLQTFLHNDDKEEWEYQTDMIEMEQYLYL